jgi:hypothetical protein
MAEDKPIKVKVKVKVKVKREVEVRSGKMWLAFPQTRCCIYADEVLI